MQVLDWSGISMMLEFTVTCEISITLKQESIYNTYALRCIDTFVRTCEVELVGVAQLDSRDVEFFVSDRRKKRNHVKMAVVANWSHFLWKTVVFREAAQPFFKYGICEGV